MYLLHYKKVFYTVHSISLTNVCLLNNFISLPSSLIETKFSAKLEPNIKNCLAKTVFEPGKTVVVEAPF